MASLMEILSGQIPPEMEQMTPEQKKQALAMAGINAGTNLMQQPRMGNGAAIASLLQNILGGYQGAQGQYSKMLQEYQDKVSNRAKDTAQTSYWNAQTEELKRPKIETPLDRAKTEHYIAQTKALGMPKPESLSDKLAREQDATRVTSRMSGDILMNPAQREANLGGMLPEEERVATNALKEQVFRNKEATTDYNKWDIERQKLGTNQEQEDKVEITLKDGQKIKVRPESALSHEDRIAAQEQNRMAHENNLLLRKDLANQALELRKRLPASQVRELNDKQVVLDKYVNAINSFDDKYAGSIIGGPTASYLHEKFGTEKQQPRVNWWKQFKMLDSVLRHDLFGATLTGFEKKSWDSITVDENTDPDIVRTQLNTRLQAAQTALSRQMQGFTEKGYPASPAGGQQVGAQTPSGGTKKIGRFNVEIH